MCCASFCQNFTTQLTYFIFAIFLDIRANYKVNDPKYYAGEYVNMACEFDGEPDPTVSWQWNNIKINSSSTRMVAKDGTLTIKNVSINDSGKYMCNVSNAAGMVTGAFVNLFVKG